MKLTQRKVQHLYWRAGFFESYAKISGDSRKNLPDLWRTMTKASQDFTPLHVVDKNESPFKAMAAMTSEQKQMLRKESRSNIMKLNKMWLDHMLKTEGALRERMALFWHNHFACSSKNAFFIQSYLDTIRKHALGNFRELLYAVSKEPAMLQYLNNQQNKKLKPNENFAREVMELFTLGIGNYTEQDVKNAARAFTGWAFNKDGVFILRKRQHDYGRKEIFGKSGNFTGEEVLEMLLENKQTARYITRKLYTYLVNEQVHEQRVEKLADRFYESGYDILTLLENIFLSDWFYDTENIGVKIKSPIDLLIGLGRSLDVTFSNSQGPIFIQKHLGQLLLNPPNVAGWPGGQNWIDSSTLLFRTRLTEFILLASEINLNTKDRGDDNDAFKMNRKLKKLGATANLDSLEWSLKNIKSGQMLSTLSDFLLQKSVDQPKIPGSSDSLTGQIVRICRLPEFQLC